MSVNHTMAGKLIDSVERLHSDLLVRSKWKRLYDFEHFVSKMGIFITDIILTISVQDFRSSLTELLASSSARNPLMSRTVLLDVLTILQISASLLTRSTCRKCSRMDLQLC